MITSLSQETIVKYLVRLFIIFVILPLHEYAHARTAYKLGDDTAMYQGRMTLNPISHIDPIGALCLLLGGFGWAKPVPIDPTRFNRKHSMRFGVAVTALAGPVSNLIAAFVGMVLYRFYILSSVYTNYITDLAAGEAVKNGPELLQIMLYFFVSINIGLAVFNLIPIPPLDGSKVLGYFTGAKVDRWLAQNAQIIRIVFLLVIVTGILSAPLGFLGDLLYRGFWFLTNWVPMLFH